jgi:hypothetical protein
MRRRNDHIKRAGTLDEWEDRRWEQYYGEEECEEEEEGVDLTLDRTFVGRLKPKRPSRFMEE